MAEKAKVAFVGATGYGGAELLRNLLNHPMVEVTRAVAIDHVGEPIGQVHPPLAGISESFLHLRHYVKVGVAIRAVADGICNPNRCWRLQDPRAVFLVHLHDEHGK